MTQPTTPLLQCRELNVTYRGGAWALRDVGLEIQAGERVALIGESGCGKTTLVRTLLGLLPVSAHVTGTALFDGTHALINRPEPLLRRLRGRHIGYVPQNPHATFDPIRSVGSQLAEAWRCHGERVDRARLVDALISVGIERVDDLMDRRPSAWSGGMLQRASILAATALGPRLVLADEPTSAVDRPLARRMLDLIAERSETMVVVTHDIDLIDGMVDRVVVMYAGRVVEGTSAASLHERSRHPYTRALLRALPKPGVLPLETPGDPPKLDVRDTGCAFAPRCPAATARCGERPALVGGVACHHPEPEP